MITGMTLNNDININDKLNKISDDILTMKKVLVVLTKNVLFKDEYDKVLKELSNANMP